MKERRTKAIQVNVRPVLHCGSREETTRVEGRPHPNQTQNTTENRVFLLNIITPLYLNGFLYNLKYNV